MDSIEYINRAVNVEDNEDIEPFSVSLNKFKARNGHPERPRMTLEEHEKLFGH